MNNELNFPPHFERLVLGCIDASKQASKQASKVEHAAVAQLLGDPNSPERVRHVVVIRFEAAHVVGLRRGHGAHEARELALELGAHGHGRLLGRGAARRGRERRRA